GPAPQGGLPRVHSRGAPQHHRRPSRYGEGNGHRDPPPTSDRRGAAASAPWGRESTLVAQLPPANWAREPSIAWRTTSSTWAGSTPRAWPMCTEQISDRRLVAKSSSLRMSALCRLAVLADHAISTRACTA